MKLYKLNQGSTFENLKHFIYLTNEYGVPSDEFVDDFIDQFGRIILNDNFTIEEYHCKILDELWKDIVKDCTNNNIEYKENYSNIFYTVLSKKALNKIKEGWEQSDWNQLTEQDKLELLKQFIIDFDDYIIEGIDMQELYLENTPDLIKIDEDGNEYIEVKYIYKKSIKATGRLYRDSSLVVLSDSQLDEIKNCASNTVIKLRQTYSKYINDKHLIKDIKCKSPSMAGNLVYGGPSNGFTDWANTRGSQIDLYRWKSNNEVKTDKRAENAEKSEATVTTKPIQHYKLRDSEFCQGKIGKTLKYNGENFAEILSDTQIKVSGQIHDIGEYIANNDLDINNIKLGNIIRFVTLYIEA